MTRGLVVTAIAIGVSLLGADASMACSCVPPNERKLLADSDGAFVGRLVAVRPVDPPDQGEPISSGDPTDFIYRVGRVYKRGPGLRRGRRVRVRSVRSEATCGLQRHKGSLYALFLERRNHRWHSNLCLTTTPRRMRRAAEDASASPAGSPGSAGCA
jgi:hypothetical protein